MELALECVRMASGGVILVHMNNQGIFKNIYLGTVGQCG